MAYKQNNPFSRKTSSPLKSLDPSAYTSYADRFANPDFNQETDDFYARELARKKAVRGDERYKEVLEDKYSGYRNIGNPYGILSKAQQTDKLKRKYPHLMSGHSSDIVDTYDPFVVNSTANPQTIRARNKWMQDYMHRGNINPNNYSKEALQKMDDNARISAEIGGRLRIAMQNGDESAIQAALKEGNALYRTMSGTAMQGEAHLGNPLNPRGGKSLAQLIEAGAGPAYLGGHSDRTRRSPWDRDRLQQYLPPLESGSDYNMDYINMANPTNWNTRLMYGKYKDLSDRATTVQDFSDKFRNVGYDTDETMRQFDQSDYRAPTMEELHSKYFGKDSRSGVNYGKGTRFNTRSGNKY